MSRDPLVRQARIGDAAQVVPLLVEAIDHLALTLAGVASHAAAVPLFTRLFEERGNRYSHEYVHVLELDEEIAAAILAYPGADEAMLAAPVLAACRQREPSATHRHEPESAPGVLSRRPGGSAPASRRRPCRAADRRCLRARRGSRICARRPAGGPGQARREAALRRAGLRGGRRTHTGRAPLRAHEPSLVALNGVGA